MSRLTLFLRQYLKIGNLACVKHLTNSKSACCISSRTMFHIFREKVIFKPFTYISIFLWLPFVLAIDRIFSIHFHFPCYVSRLGKNPNNQPPISSTQCFQRSRTKTFRFFFLPSSTYYQPAADISAIDKSFCTWSNIISTECALRLPLTFENHPSNPIPSIPLIAVKTTSPLKI